MAWIPLNRKSRRKERFGQPDSAAGRGDGSAPSHFSAFRFSGISGFRPGLSARGDAALVRDFAKYRPAAANTAARNLGRKPAKDGANAPLAENPECRRSAARPRRRASRSARLRFAAHARSVRRHDDGRADVPDNVVCDAVNELKQKLQRAEQQLIESLKDCHEYYFS